jgi:glycosyltransferase involved in cell wall biosynthesis
MSRPYFSIIIPVYNRDTYIKRCVESCLNQSFSDFEILVVDDGSTDNTLKILSQIKDPRLNTIIHFKNKGINAALFSGTSTALGLWIINLDSDWILFPHSLQKLFDITNSLNKCVVGVRARQVWDTGFISPPFVPKDPIDYIGRIKYVEAGGGYDVLGCYRKEMIDKVTFYPERLGGYGTELLAVLNMHQQGLMLCIVDILCMQYTDAQNSVTRAVMKDRVNNLRKFAPDMLWMYEETLRLHGNALREYGPNQYLSLFRNIALQNFYLGNRMLGLKSLLKYLQKKPFDFISWITLSLGLLGPGFILYGNAIRNHFRSFFVEARNNKSCSRNSLNI